ncbi:MAG: serine/threonine protein kinase [Anaerolineae bacterium]|nr:serine/threonine protein kinase [Anaerolineae bacterium]
MTKLLESGIVLRERYQIVSPIGQGGMGAVYRAADLLLPGRVCALKEIAPRENELSDEALRQLQTQFRREARVLARLDHPNLPKVSDYFTAKSREYLVMDFVPGYDLREIIEQQKEKGIFLEYQRVMRWIEQLCDALTYLHSQAPPILHRDIKPSNIKLTPSGFLKLVDFGLVKLLTSDKARTITVVQGRGTAAYTPLEQYGSDDEHTNIQSDIYALTATLYHLLTGRPPATAQERFLNPKILVLPSKINADIPAHVERVILQALSLHPDDRPPDVETFRALLRQEQATSSTDTVDTVMNNSPRPHWKDMLRANIHLVIASAILIFLAILLTP